MARTSEAAVAVVLDTTLESAQIQAFVDDASAWIDAHLLDKGYSEATLTLIEKYLACHFCTLRDPRLSSSRVGDTAEKYQVNPEVNEYLRLAIGMDPSGAIEDAFGGDEARKRVRFRVGSGYDSTLGLGVTEA